MDGLQEVWTATHPAIKWVLILGGSSYASYLLKKIHDIYVKAEHGFTNCIPTIQKNTGETTAAIRELITILKTKAEDGKL